MNKKILIICVVLIGGCGILFVKSFQNENKASILPPTTPTPTITIASPDTFLSAIANEFSKKYNKPDTTFKLEVITNAGEYAKGSVQFKEENGGGLWFAEKIDDEWKLVYDGNGIIKCDDLKEYSDFPADIIPQCFDDNKNTLIKR